MSKAVAGHKVGFLDSFSDSLVARTTTIVGRGTEGDRCVCRTYEWHLVWPNTHH